MKFKSYHTPFLIIQGTEMKSRASAYFTITKKLFCYRPVKTFVFLHVCERSNSFADFLPFLWKHELKDSLRKENLTKNLSQTSKVAKKLNLWRRVKVKIILFILHKLFSTVHSFNHNQFGTKGGIWIPLWKMCGNR